MNNVRASLMAQIACADAVDSNFICLTKAEGKRILKLLEEQEEEIDEISDEYLDLGNEIAKMPKVVRCKECWKRNYDNCPFREWADVFPPDDFYCADGERKSD